MNKLSWTTKLMGLITLALGALLLFQLLYVIPYLRNREVERTQAHQEEIAHNIALLLATKLGQGEKELTQMAERAEFRNMDLVNQTQTMVWYRELIPQFSSLFALDAEGWFVSGTAKDLTVYQTQSYADADFFAVPFDQGQVYLSSPRSYFEGTYMGASVSVPIESDTGERVGVLIGGVWLNEFIEYVKDYSLGEGTVACAVDTEGTVFAHSGMDLFALEEGPLSLDFSDRSLVQVIMDGEMGGSRKYDRKGTSYFGSYVTLESSGWGVVVETPMSAILAGSNVLAGRLLMVNIVLFAIAFGVTLVFARQITAEQMRVEQELRHREQEFKALVENAPDVISRFDKEFRHVYINPAVKREAGMPPEAFVGKTNRELGTPEDLVIKWEDAIKTVFETGQEITVETEYPTPSGTKHYSNRLAPEFAEDDSVETVLNIGRNITGQKRAEEALKEYSERLEEMVEQRTEELQESEAKYRNLTESLDELIYRADPETFVATYVNSAIETLYGYTVEEWLADPTLWERTIHPDDQERTFAEFTEIQEKVESRTVQYRIIRKDQTVRWGEDHVSWEKDEQGNPVSMTGVMYDITERKEMQERLLRSEKLAVLGQLAGGVGHELRNPLGAIKNAAYFLNMVLEEPEPEVKETLEILDREVATSERIISSLLDFARPKPPVRRKVNVNDVVQDALSRTTVPENVEVVTQLDETLPTVLADPNQLAQVFGNLMLNAIQAMPDGGQLVVKSEVLSPEWVSVSVADTGVGISEEDLEKIFEPLFTTKAKGIGLGLAVTRTLVEGHGGTIEVESPSTGLRTGEVGKGSTFTVRLPMTREEGK